MRTNGHDAAVQQPELDSNTPVDGYLPHLSEDELRLEREIGEPPELIDPDNPSPFGPNGTGIDDQYTNNGFDLPMIEQRPSRLSMSEAEMNAGYMALVERHQAAGGIDSLRMVMEYGALAKLEMQMRGMVHDLSKFPEAGEVMLHKARRCIHDIVISNPALSDKERNETGLVARVEAVNDLLAALDEELPRFVAEMSEFDEGCGVDMDRLRVAFRNCVEVEQRRLDALHQSLQPSTFGNRLLSNLEDVKDVVVGAFQKEQLVGDVRRHRNDALTAAVQGLVDASIELRDHAGDAEWERGNGAMVSNNVGKFTDDIRSLTKGVEDQIDFGAINTELKKAGRNLDEAAEHAADEEQKQRLKKAMEVMRQALEAIGNALKKVFGRRDDHQTGVSRPTPA